MQRIEHAPAAVAITTAVAPVLTVVRPSLTVMSLLSTLTNVSGGNITALTVARSLDGTTYGPERSVTTGIPLAAGATLDVDVIDEPAVAYRFTITAASAGVASLISRGAV
tara:strand:- start:388 stop:717 length:330 start_codon:yes stop_codon:yes gene_type:complete